MNIKYIVMYFLSIPLAELLGMPMVRRMVTPRQIRAGRALLGWSQQQLADKAIVSRGALIQLEKGEADSRLSTLKAIQKALIKAGIKFLPANGEGEGVRLISPK